MLMTMTMMMMLMLISPFLTMKMIINMLMIIFFIAMTSFGISFTPTIFISTWNNMENFNLVMILLSIFVSSLMIMVSLNYTKEFKNPKLLNLMILLLLFTVMIFFITDNLLMLYLMFELSLLPTLVLILVWGYQPERLQASFYFVLYTICASLPLLIMIMKMINEKYTFSLMSYSPMFMVENNFNFNLSIISLLLAFLVKLPSWGVHLWLPKAHVEAPISGSMILAGILLKLGGYGLMKMMTLIYKINNVPTSLFFSISLWGALAVSFICMSSMDMKSLIAYSSVIHMNILILGLLTKSTIGMVGAMMMMISHGISSPGMFTLANYNYEKTLTRNLLLQKNIALIQPTMMMMWFMLISANMAAPPSLNLVSEIMISMSVIKMYTPMFLIIIMVTLLSGGYNLYLFSAQLGNKIFLTSSQKLSSLNYLILISQAIPCYLLTFIIPLCMSM